MEKHIRKTGRGSVFFNLKISLEQFFPPSLYISIALLTVQLVPR
jgi:hypothetical protein